MLKSTDLSNRMGEPRGAASVRADLAKMKGPKAQLDVEQRLAEAKALLAPVGPALHCGHCWGEGRDAAIRALERDPQS